MVFQKITFTRLFKPAGNHFGFETNGKRYFDVVAKGRPNIREGMTVIALLRTPDGFCDDGLLGWIDCEDGSVACNGTLGHIGWLITAFYFSVMHSLQVIADPTNADFLAVIIGAGFFYFSIKHLEAAVASFMIKRALMKVRNLVMPK